MRPENACGPDHAPDAALLAGAVRPGARGKAKSESPTRRGRHARTPRMRVLARVPAPPSPPLPAARRRRAERQLQPPRTESSVRHGRRHGSRTGRLLGSPAADSTRLDSTRRSSSALQRCSLCNSPRRCACAHSAACAAAVFIGRSSAKHRGTQHVAEPCARRCCAPSLARRFLRRVGTTAQVCSGTAAGLGTTWECAAWWRLRAAAPCRLLQTEHRLQLDAALLELHLHRQPMADLDAALCWCARVLPLAASACCMLDAGTHHATPAAFGRRSRR